MDKRSILVNLEDNDLAEHIARAIAAQSRKRYTETSWQEASSPFGLSKALGTVDPYGVIVVTSVPVAHDGSFLVSTLSVLKMLATSETLTVEAKGQDPKEVPSPMLIFVPDRLVTTNLPLRHFRVITEV